MFCLSFVHFQVYLDVFQIHILLEQTIRSSGDTYKKFEDFITNLEGLEA